MADTALKESNSSSSDLSVDECEEAEEQDVELFEDAHEVVPILSEMDLATAIEETIVALNLFLNNHYIEAKSRMQPWADRSVYHALGYGTIMYLQATLTFEMNDIQAAVNAVKQAVSVCDKQRKKHSMLSRKNFSEFTEEQIHAELCYAELLIERALLTFVQDENLISFVKGGIKIKMCHSAYKDCLRILEEKEWKDAEHRAHFESGVKLGTGIFNLVNNIYHTV